jgi:adenylate cyclase
MIAVNIKHLNRGLAEAERSPLQYGIGINGGEVILGDVGSGENTILNAKSSSLRRCTK